MGGLISAFAAVAHAIAVIGRIIFVVDAVSGTNIGVVVVCINLWRDTFAILRGHGTFVGLSVGGRSFQCFGDLGEIVA